MATNLEAPAAPDFISRAVLLAAHRALLDDQERSDAQVSLARLWGALAAITGADFRLWVPAGPPQVGQLRPAPTDPGADQNADHDGHPVWPEVPATLSAPQAIAHRLGAVLALPLRYLGQPLGCLLVRPKDALALQDATGTDAWAARLEPAAQSAAALLARQRARETDGIAQLPGLVRAALHQANTFVWDWDIATDRLGDIDEGEAMLGYPAGALGNTQQDWNRIVHPDDHFIIDHAYEAHLRGEAPVYECVYRARAADGRWRWIEERGRVVDWSAQGQPRRMLGTQADVTDLKELEVVRQQREIAETASHAKSEFLSRVSHELRTPLHAVLGFAQLIESDAAHPLPPATQRWMRLLIQAGRHLNGMIGDLLDLTQVEAGRLSVAVQDVTVAPLLAEVADMLRPQATAAAVTLHVEPVVDGLRVRADPLRLRQVLINLVSNALKYNRPGGHASLRAQAGDADVVLAVEDNGVGIAPEQLPGLFVAFNRLGRDAGPVEGIGLGLVLTQSLVHLMGGRIDVASRPGVGSTFSVTLPNAAGQDLTTTSSAPS